MKIDQCFVIANVSVKSKLQHPPGGGNLNNNFPKSQMPGGLPGGDVEASIWLIHNHGGYVADPS